MPTAVLLLQLVVILLTARGCGWLLKHLGQPSVVGEMAAGLVLGPICLGALLPQAHARLFAGPSLQGLSALATVGLVLFMFLAQPLLLLAVALFAVQVFKDLRRERLL